LAEYPDCKRSLQSAEGCRQKGAAKAEWFSLSALPQLAFDHYDIMQDAIRKYKDLKK